jgi:hypothetical protein
VGEEEGEGEGGKEGREKRKKEIASGNMDGGRCHM